MSAIGPPDGADPDDVRRHLDDLTKPPGSLGRLEGLAVRLARIYGDPPPPLRNRAVAVLAGDHGVARRGVSAYPRKVTVQMCRNLATGGAAINAIAGAAGARVVVADLGVDGALDGVPGLRAHKVRRGTRDMVEGPAMTREEAARAIEEGVALFEAEVERTHVVALGEMGIGNTTAASALAAAYLDRDAGEVVGSGTGLSPARRKEKVEVVRRAVRRIRDVEDPLDILAEVGGLEIAGLVGIVLAAARHRRAVVTDGFIATGAALATVRLCPAVRDYLFASHVSPEPGHPIVLKALGLEPLFDFEMRLGEGTGAALALPILDAAGSLLREMATFSSAGVSGPDDEPEGGQP
ncbi:MAG: nicotinate-nucleotide--dimethylbenzimidazole phosphoribosyltransferase [Gemmatimonadetes bacterium]|nr:nicotinate-nucleotide--dimethylbenzimidazole phosphoribosyltransferase [Gemmatimonadota bacterium]NIT88667.1 nicotinate-nucleotide--dimethylbenzimidazole phosphoribosyltransferase [Gemmatimonadota bacterium]NIU32482.1 nicotinate-nucleotide--dimethylbenzimidazole phosphoribosyltransferase [Gemmatimonadota bacterium]NIU36964.1 nicotinate-nucleotide--dimethylbenzimidazole phosphoribosyltransferase [Gemmatimonadota bacterium]NIV62846.1 nicotinate-nucleotide--dimethylbenzimidazole phosphoribosylt